MIPNGWSEATLNDLVDEDAPICYGILMPGEGVSDGVPVLKVRDMTPSGIDTRNLLRTTRAIDEQYKRSRLKSGDLVLSIRGTTGRVAITPPELENGNITQDTARIRVVSGVDSRFLLQALRSARVQAQIQLHTVGQAVKGINLGEVKKLKLYLPPLTEQKKIAEILSCWDRGIEEVEKLLGALRSRKRAIMQTLLTGKLRLPGSSSAEVEFVKLKDHAFIRRGASPRPIQDPKWFSETGRGWIRISDVTAEPTRYLKKTDQYLSELGASKSVEVNPGDLIMSICATIGVPKILGIEACIHDGFVLFRGFEKDFDKYFLFHYLNMITERLASSGQPGTQKNLNTDIVGNIEVPLFSRDEQTRIVALLNAAEEQIHCFAELKARYLVQKQALMQHLLTGKVRVRGAA